MENRDGPRVLVVDDEQDTCSNLSDILTDLGYRVDVANEGQAALELVRRNPYNVALLDLRMPGMDGLTLYREIKKLRAGTVAILVTAYAGGATSEEALGAGAGRPGGPGGRGRGEFWPSRSIFASSWAWSIRHTDSRRSWWSTTTTSC